LNTLRFGGSGARMAAASGLPERGGMVLRRMLILLLVCLAGDGSEGCGSDQLWGARLAAGGLVLRTKVAT
jgi:hypothetical protein